MVSWYPESAAWTRKEGQNKSGGLNEKGHVSHMREQIWQRSKST